MKIQLNIVGIMAKDHTQLIVSDKSGRPFCIKSSVPIDVNKFEKATGQRLPEIKKIIGTTVGGTDYPVSFFCVDDKRSERRKRSIFSLWRKEVKTDVTKDT